MSRTSRIVGQMVGFCTRRPYAVIIAALILGALALIYASQNFAMTTDTGQLISARLPWRQREIAFSAAFPQNGDTIVAVVDAKTPELADLGARRLAEALRGRPKLFRLVRQPDGGAFFGQNGLLYQSPAEVNAAMASLIKAEPLLGPMAADPSLRGLAGVLSTAAVAAQTDPAKLADMDLAMRRLAASLNDVESGRPAVFSWRTLVDDTPRPRELRRIVLVSPTLDYDKLEPGRGASDEIRQTARRLGIDAAHGARLRLTGDVPLQDEEFASLTERAGLIVTAMISAIVLMLWLAVRSAKVVTAVLATMVVGLVVTAALGLMVFHRFNVISVAFFPLFVGLGVDFGIQFGVRYRAEQLDHTTQAESLAAAGQGVGRSLAIAASAIALGFLAFLPTQYSGVAQLGLIAGAGMMVALGLSLTLLPALIAVLRPKPGRAVHAGFSFTAPLDRFVLARRRLVLGVAGGGCLVSLCLLPFLRFDFNPLHLRSAKVESMSTMLELMRDPDESPNTIEILKPSLASADAAARRLERLPQVAHAVTLSGLVPDDQPQKLAAIQDASTLLDLEINPIVTSPQPSDAEVVASLRKASGDLGQAAAVARGPQAADARVLAASLARLAAGPPQARSRAADVLITPLNVLLDQVRLSLTAQPVTLQSLPDELKRDWVTPDGRARVSVQARGDSNDNAVLTRFTAAVRKVEPTSTGVPIGIEESGRTISGAFLEAGVLSFIAITVLLFVVLRRPRDVLVTMTPIVITGLLTLATCVVIGQPLNYANIIALPLLFGIGVAFHIYFVIAWRAGTGHLLDSSLARAVLFSALTTATGFGSLWLSSHPGTASMGKVLMISLLWTLTTALITQPALMGAAPEPLERSG